MDVSPDSALRFVLIWVVGTLALAGLSGRQLRLQVVGLLCRTAFPVLATAVFVAIPWAADNQFPEWWDQWSSYVLPVSTLLLGLAIWLPQQGARLSWAGAWDFAHPRAEPPPDDAVTGQSVPRQTRLRLLGYLMILAGLAGTAVPTMITSNPRSFPEWLALNGFLIGLAGLFAILYGGKVLRLARTRQARDFPSLPVRDDAWVAGPLWVAAWLCCLAGLALTFGGATTMFELRDLPWWASFAAVWSMLVGGLLFTYGRKTFLRARRHRARIIPTPRILAARSYVLYLRSFENDQRQKSVDEVPMPGMSAGVVGFVISGRSAEEQIADILAPVGPLIAVGAPGEKVPHAGAVRMYLPDESDEAWREPVRRLMLRSRLTVLTLGTGEGTRWELAEALERLPPQRLVLVIPSMSAEDYESIRAPHRERLPPGPTWLVSYRRQPVQGVVRFAADWTPDLVPVMENYGQPTRSLFSTLIPAFGPVFTALEEYERA